MKNQSPLENLVVTETPPLLACFSNSVVSEMLERISDGFFALDNTWQITYMNRYFENMYAIRREDFLCRNLWEVYPSLIGTVYDEVFHRAMKDSVTEKFERYSTKYDSWFEVSAHPSSSGLSVFFRDITQRKLAEEALHLSNERFRLAAKTEAIYDWDITTDQLHWGEGLFSLFGYTSPELQIEQWTNALFPGDSDLLMSDLHQSLQNPAIVVWEQEYRIRHKEGYYCYVSECGHIIRDQQGHAVRMVGVMRNVSQRKALEEQLEQQRQKMAAAVINAQERERAQIGRELHDNVNQILTSVKLYQEHVLTSNGNNKELVAKSIHLLLQAINENRRLSRQLAPPDFAQASLAETVRELVDTFAAARKFELTLHASYIKDLNASEELHLGVYRILQEHLTNVCKHSAAKYVVVTLEEENGFLILEVADNGCGFDKTKKRAGIGLTNMQMRAKHLGGTLTIDSEPGKGCTLTGMFPITVP